MYYKHKKELMEGANKKILFVFFWWIISIIPFNLAAQDKRIELGKYVHQTGSHGATEMLVFNEENIITFSKQILTRPSSQVCNGSYIIKGDTLYIDYKRDSIPYKPYYKVIKELNLQELGADITVHLNVLLKTIEYRNKENLKKNAEYDSVVQSSSVNIEVIDSLGNSVLELYTSDSKITLQLSRKSELVVSAAGTLYNSKISLNNFEGNEVFIELMTYEKYDLPCSLDNHKFYIQDITANSIGITPSDSEDVIIYYKTD